MKLKYIFFTILFLVFNTVTHASQTIINDKSSSTAEAIRWEIGLNEGGFQIINGTTHNLLVQVKIDKGVIGVFSKGNTGTGSNCKLDLNAEHNPQVGLCELQPGVMLNIDLDYAWASANYPQKATGIYQTQQL